MNAFSDSRKQYVYDWNLMLIDVLFSKTYSDSLNCGSLIQNDVVFPKGTPETMKFILLLFSRVGLPIVPV